MGELAPTSRHPGSFFFFFFFLNVCKLFNEKMHFNYYLFIFGCVGSSFLCEGFL